MSARVCLNMIVKNESAVIEQCLRSLAPAIDCFVICDTGSTDDTVEKITSIFASLDIPGEIVHTEFRDFAQARNEALAVARESSLEFDHLLFCDADMELVVVDPEWKSSISSPAHQMIQNSATGREYPNIRLISRDLDAQYVGVTHEYLAVPCDSPILTGLRYIDHAIGANRTVKYERDIRLLEQGLQDDPENSRYMFYLANSLFECGRYTESIEWYRQRIAIDHFPDERFISNYRIGLALKELADLPGFTKQMLDTWNEFPDRAEPLHSLAFHALAEGKYHLTLAFARIGAAIEKPNGALFVENAVYEWRLDDLLAVSLYWTGQSEEAAQINSRLLAVAPESERARIAENLAFCLENLQRP